MSEQMIQVAGSHRNAPRGMTPMGRQPEDATITVSIYLKPVGALEGSPTSSVGRADIAIHRLAEHGDDISAISAFAATSDLKIEEIDAGRRLIKLTGNAAAMEKAFGTTLHRYDHGGTGYRIREGSLQMPAGLAPRIAAVLGLDNRPAATPKIVPHRGPTPPPGFLPTEVADLYGFSAVDASGQCIGIIELGGGYAAADNDAAFAAMSVPLPSIVAVGVDGGANDPTDTSGANGEVALDIQVAGGVAPGAKLAVYFAPNTDQGFVDAISQAVHDRANEPSVLSISWGSAESDWTAQAVTAMGQAFQDATQLGVTICAASGDGLATDGVKDGKAHVDFPASHPIVLGCGGTRITAASSAITEEVVWNSNGGGTGGGVSIMFPLPNYQAHAHVPALGGKSGGRGVPDIAGNADPDSGYRIVTGGTVGIIGGTSAVAPLWAGIVAAINAARTKPLGQIHALLYDDPHALRDIVSGDNKVGSVGFTARKGWDACTGLGSPVGATLRTTLSES